MTCVHKFPKAILLFKQELKRSEPCAVRCVIIVVVIVDVVAPAAAADDDDDHHHHHHLHPYFAPC